MQQACAKISVLQVVEELSPAGTETWLLNVLRHLDRDRFTMDFLVHTGRICAYDGEVERLGSKVLRCLHPHRPFAYGRRFRTLLREHGPYDVIHSHVHHFSGVSLGLAAGRVPIRIAHSHTTADAERTRPTRWPRRLYLAAMKRALRRFSTGKFAASADAAAALFGPDWQSDSRCRLLHCGIPLEGFRYNHALRQELGIPAGAWVLAHVGRFEPPKNHDFLIDVAARLAARDSSAHFLLVGDGRLRQTTEAKIRQLTIESRFTILRDRPDVPELLASAADAFLFPSLYEGLGLALVEAQAAGLPCLFTDTLPAEASVMPALCNRLPLEAGPERWSVEASRVKAQPRMRLEDSRAAVARSHFNIESSVARLEEAYAPRA